MVAQPRILRARLCDGDFQRLTRGCDGLVDGDAHTALGDEQVGHRRRPVAAVHGADRNRMRKWPTRGQRIGRRMPTLLEVRDRLPDRPELLDRADAFSAARSMRRDAVHAQPKCQRTAIGGNDVEFGWFGDHACVGAPAALQRRVRTKPTVLFAEHRGQHEVAAQFHARVLDRLRCVHVRDQAGFHIACSAAVHRAVTHLGGIGRVDPRIGVAGWHNVAVPVQHQRSTIAAAG